MHLVQNILFLLATSQIALSLFVPTPDNVAELVKRKGGGGGGRSGGSGSSGSSSSGSSSGSAGSSSGSTGSTGSSSGTGSTGSTGSSGSSSGSRGVGSTSSPKSYGGSYAGGATTGYGAGQRSPRGLTPYFLPIAALGIFPGLWLAGAYAYNYNNPYYLRDSNNNNQNTSLPVVCLCEQYNPCGCDDNEDTTYINSLSSNGTIQGLNSQVAKVTDVNGTRTLVINGTLANDSSTSAAGQTYPRNVLEYTGFWLPVAIILYSVFGV